MRSVPAGMGNVINGITFLSPKEAYQLLQNEAVLVDLRDEYYKNGREFKVDRLVSIYHKDIEEKYHLLPQDVLLILADYVGIHSKEAAHYLMEKGFANVASLIGGIVEWVVEGMPTSINTDDELVGGCACQLKKRKRIKV